MRSSIYLAVAIALLVGFGGGWMAGTASARRASDHLLVELGYLDAAARLKLSLNLIEESKTLGCQRVVSSLEKLADFSVTELGSLGAKPSTANDELIREQLQKLQQYELATHGTVNPKIGVLLESLPK